MQAMPPILTVAPAAKPVPVIVTLVPPAMEPLAGAIAVRESAGAILVNVKVAVWPLLVAVTVNGPPIVPFAIAVMDATPFIVVAFPPLRERRRRHCLLA